MVRDRPHVVTCANSSSSDGSSLRSSRNTRLAGHRRLEHGLTGGAVVAGGERQRQVRVVDRVDGGHAGQAAVDLLRACRGRRRAPRPPGGAAPACARAARPGVSAATSRPRFRITTRPATASTSDSTCVDSNTACSRPSRLISVARVADLVRIEADRRFVQDQDRRPAQQRVRQADALAVAARQRADDLRTGDRPGPRR